MSSSVSILLMHLGNVLIMVFLQGSHYEAFMKAATSDNEIQFVEANNIEFAKVLYPDVKATNFLGIVKSEPERYTAYGELATLKTANWPPG